MQVGKRPTGKQEHDASETKRSASKSIGRPAGSGATATTVSSSQRAPPQQDRVVQPGAEGVLIQNVTTQSGHQDGLGPRAGSSGLSMRLQGNHPGLPSSVQKALSGVPREGSKRKRSESSSPSPSSSSAGLSGRSSSDERADLEEMALKHERTLEAQPNELKNFLKIRNAQPKPVGQLNGGAIRSRIVRDFQEVDVRPFLTQRTLLGPHAMVPGVDFVPYGKTIFGHVGWKGRAGLQREADKHIELFDPAVLQKVSALGVAQTDNFIRAYIYRNSHTSSDPAQSRSRGDVLMIDERQGLLVALSLNGSIKSARLEEPEALRNYLQDEKYKDLE